MKKSTVKFAFSVIGTTLSWKCTQEIVERTANQNLDCNIVTKETYKATGCRYSVTKNFGENEFFVLIKTSTLTGGNTGHLKKSENCAVH